MKFKRTLLATAISAILFSATAGASDNVQVNNDEIKTKLKSVKDLFNESKNNVPKAPEVISNRPEIVDFEEAQDITTSPDLAENAKQESEKNTSIPNLETVQTSEAEPSNNSPQQEALEKKEEKEKEFLKRIEGQSILFEQKKIRSVLRVFNAYNATRKKDRIPPEQMAERKKTLEELQLELLAKIQPDEVPQEDEGATEAATVRIPAYIKLDSIIYHSPSNKKVWVNSQKFHQGEENGEIEIRSIGKDFVIVALDTSDSTMSENIIIEKIKNSRSASAISYNSIDQAITFRLSLNQYIDFTAMEIKEGSFDISTIDSSDPARTFYDPKIPTDRFAPLEDDSITEQVAGAATEAVDRFKDNFRSESAEDNEDFTAIDADEQ